MIENIKNTFSEKFSRQPNLFRAPGRVNLIGEHTDYNEGFVLPASIDKEIIFAIAPNETETCNVHALDLGEDYSFHLNDISNPVQSWPDYLMGVVVQLQKRAKLSGFDLVFGGNIPLGAGLSSSAALECGLSFALNEIFALAIPRLDMVQLSQAAENEFVGVQCGIMDQFASMMGKANTALKLDCRSLEFEEYPFNMNDYFLVLCDTQVKHSLASSEYNTRRQECEEGVKTLRKFYDINSLRDVDQEMLQKHQTEFDPVVYKRCMYVVMENQRVHLACRALQNNDLETFGQKMYLSHEGLSNSYEVSCPELDLFVDITKNIPGVLGARMMGGGFGGCTINLVHKDTVDDLQQQIDAGFEVKFSQKAKFYKVKIEEGVSQHEKSISRQ